MPDMWATVTELDVTMQERLADGPVLGLDDERFDVVVFDGDDATATVALGDHDLLQASMDAMMANSVHDRWLVRRLPTLVGGAGFGTTALGSHGFGEAAEGGTC